MLRRKARDLGLKCSVAASALVLGAPDSLAQTTTPQSLTPENAFIFALLGGVGLFTAAVSALLIYSRKQAAKSERRANRELAALSRRLTQTEALARLDEQWCCFGSLEPPNRKI